MRSDLNKLLCERERRGSENSFSDDRHKKVFADNLDEDGESRLGGSHEGMKVRHVRNYGERKAFNENLVPLKKLCDKAVGRPWNKFYSELCEVFDMKSVINQHILLHLEQYIERSIIFRDGKFYENYYGGVREFDPRTYHGIYVDPRDGIIKRGRGNSRSNRDREKAKQLNRQRAATERVRKLDDGSALHLIDTVRTFKDQKQWEIFLTSKFPGYKIVEERFRQVAIFEDREVGELVYQTRHMPPTGKVILSSNWYQFDVLPVPVAVVTYKKPLDRDEFDVHGRLVKWDKLTDQWKQRYGVAHRTGGGAVDEFHGHTVYATDFRRGVPATYHANKRAASHEVLKKAGLV